MAIQCQELVLKYMPQVLSRKALLLGRVGDCFCQMLRHIENIEKYLTEYKKSSKIDFRLKEAIKEVNMNGEVFDPINDAYYIINKSMDFYEQALKLAEEKWNSSAGNNEEYIELVRRIGIAYNELGVLYMITAQVLYSRTMKNIRETGDEFIKDNFIARNTSMYTYDIRLKEALKAFRSSEYYFQSINDIVNLASVLCNMGRLMCYRAYAKDPKFYKLEKFQLTNQEKVYYCEAFVSYSEALHILGKRECNPDIWDLLRWELTTTLYKFVEILCDFGLELEDSIEEKKFSLENMVTHVLELNDSSLKGQRGKIHEFRLAIICKRYAKICAAKFLRMANGPEVNTGLRICLSYMEKALEILSKQDEYAEWLATFSEACKLYEDLMLKTDTPSEKYQNCADILFKMFKGQIVLKSSVNEFKNSTTDVDPEKDKILNSSIVSLEGYLERALKMCNKLLETTFPKKARNIYLLKEMYKIVLSGKYKSDENRPMREDNIARLQNLLQLLDSCTIPYGEWKSSEEVNANT